MHLLRRPRGTFIFRETSFAACPLPFSPPLTHRRVITGIETCGALRTERVLAAEREALERAAAFRSPAEDAKSTLVKLNGPAR
jgi:hypothetical protein